MKAENEEVGGSDGGDAMSDFIDRKDRNDIDKEVA